MPLVPKVMLAINCYAKTWFVHLLTPFFVAVFVYGFYGFSGFFEKVVFEI